MTEDDRRAVTFDSVPDIETPEDLFAVATAMEHEAAGRYRQLAARMEAAGAADLAALFRRLEVMEAEHEDGLGAWATREGVTPATTLSFRWDMPEGLDDAALDDVGGEAALTPWKALDLAVHNEERAFAFYVNVAAKTGDPRVRAHAEHMGEEELAHVALLRLERRRALRHQRETAPSEPPQIETLADLRRFIESSCAADAAAGPGREAVRRLNEDYDALMAVIETQRDEQIVRAAQDAAEDVLRRLAVRRDEEAAG